jgi:hypothetical protein
MTMVGSRLFRGRSKSDGGAVKLLQAADGEAVIEISEVEIALVMTALGRILGLLEPWPEDKLPPDLGEGFIGLHRDFLDALRLSRDWADAVGPPFAAGENVAVSLAVTGPFLGLRDGEPGVVVSTHAEDESRDYPWCLVRLKDGRELELPELVLKRVQKLPQEG